MSILLERDSKKVDLSAENIGQFWASIRRDPKAGLTLCLKQLGCLASEMAYALDEKQKRIALVDRLKENLLDLEMRAHAYQNNRYLWHVARLGQCAMLHLRMNLMQPKVPDSLEMFDKARLECQYRAAKSSAAEAVEDWSYKYCFESDKCDETPVQVLARLENSCNQIFSHLIVEAELTSRAKQVFRTSALSDKFCELLAQAEEEHWIALKLIKEISVKSKELS